MKKAFFTICCVLALAATSFGKVDSVRYLSSKAGQNWFLSASGNANWWAGSEVFLNQDFSNINGPTFGYGVAAGKWITHNVGIRVAYDANKAQVWGKWGNLSPFDFEVNQPLAEPNSMGYRLATIYYHNLHIDGMFSPVDFFQGYYKNRFYTPVIFAGMGLACVSDKMLWVTSPRENQNYEMSFAAGLNNKFRLGKYFDLDIDFRYTLQRWSIDVWSNEDFHNENIKNRIIDQNFAVVAGLTWNIGGRTYDLPINYEDATREFKERISELENELANMQPTTVADTIVQVVTVTENNFASYPFSIFFHIDSYQLMSKRDMVNLESIAQIAKENNLKIKLTGYCDSATATPSYNKTLAENRCKKIEMLLIELGVNADNILEHAVGGVDTLSPIELNRRVIVELLIEE